MLSSPEVATEGRRVAHGRGIIVRCLVILLVAFAIGWVLHRVSNCLERRAGPAGFAQGLLQGALMPMSLPNLLVGNEVIIYSSPNTGLSYKLGYVLGVNACGALFFGYVFWRVKRWKRGPPES